ncbi:MAG: hypothetical protein HN529_11070 [Acidiferrobacteraceae bacterium]|jgi:hypothetical protein|nr:hypothetical protein [Acidiferrobacteraceae bacterium]MBT3640822.1 hypothetical protein [Acidiferrobacteraceae bacterium]MBT3768422.1 hypothetical protein [Acidiferrobacteraceae bacterium]MBT3973925.1 hypothetical protein [Acidiferrobacteraceae bacterium]MBT4396558.1 hypothetical protein [Acidiferrobacteraceae bacterium]
MTKQQTQLTMDELNQVSGSYELKNVQVTSFNPSKSRVNKSPNSLLLIEGLGSQEGRGQNGKYGHSNKPSQY